MAQIIKGAWMKLDAPIKKKKTAAKAATQEIYQLKISLKGSKPLIWRRVLVTSATTLEKLHVVIQAAMGWEGSHLHVFEVAKMFYGSHRSGEEIDDTDDEACVSLKDVVPTAKSKFTYEYDMGDSWLHDVVVEKILEPDTKVKLPACVAGAGACPPEDCGGMWGYYSILDAIADKKHPEHDEMKNWVGDDFDPEACDLDAISKRLKPLQSK